MRPRSMRGGLPKSRSVPYALRPTEGGEGHARASGRRGRNPRCAAPTVSHGPAGVSLQQRHAVDRPLFGVTLLLIAGVSLPLALAPEAGGRLVVASYDSIARHFGLLYIWAAIGGISFLGWLACSRYAGVRLGRPGEAPEFATRSWAGMLYCTGVGAGMLYWAGIEWAHYYDGPPFGVAPRSAAAIEWAASYGLFHWGPVAWCFYCLPALANVSPARTVLCCLLNRQEGAKFRWESAVERLAITYCRPGV